ncbi:MAG: SUMF1/EgtB/PvdO family nonheme iron enzyme [Planctomycetota bacterium]|nr:SUMF1/EgtB/PvdO family nonheme iron enzyme [Planctomycetota bacterium]
MLRYREELPVLLVALRFRCFYSGSMKFLRDLSVWDSASRSEQESAVFLVAEQLGSDFRVLDRQEIVCGDQEHYAVAFLHQATEIVFQLIPGGSRTVYEGFISEAPERRRVEPFLLARFPVTNRVWERGTRGAAGEDGDHPKVNVQPQEILDWLASGPKGFRLPSENEWEHGTWAGTNKRFFWGEDPDPRYYWYDKNGGEETHSVYEHESSPNALGLVDTLGHVWELCAEGHGSGGCLWSHGYSFDLQLDPPLKALENLGFRLAYSLKSDS